LAVLQRKLGSHGLKLLVVFPKGVAEDARSSLRANGIRFEIDQDGEYERLLSTSLAHPHGATLIYGPDRKVKFHLLRVVDNDLLRQLVEKYLFGEINYTPLELTAVSLVGQPLGPLNCASGTRIPQGHVIMLFPAGCSSCQLSNYGALLEREATRLQDSLSGTVDPLFVFLGGSDQKSLALVESLSLKPENVCGLSSGLLIDNYSTRMRGFTVPILLRTDENGVISEVRPFIWTDRGNPNDRTLSKDVVAYSELGYSGHIAMSFFFSERPRTPTGKSADWIRKRKRNIGCEA
jgi:hypothetical protein